MDYSMIEIRYSKSKAGLDNIFDLLYINDYIPIPLTEQRKERIELRFYLSLFKKFNMVDSGAAGASYFWNTHFICRYSDFVFKMIYDNDYDIVSFAVDEKFIEQRKNIAEANFLAYGKKCIMRTSISLPIKKSCWRQD